LDFNNQSVAFGIEQLQDKTLPHWSKHVRGAWWLLAQKGFALFGADILIGGDVPLGAGMSSSAAIGVGVIEMGLALLKDRDHTQAEKALLAVEIEHKFIGVPCGIMDQMASAAALDHSAMLLDCRTLGIDPVPIPDGVSIVVLNTMKSRELADSAYAERRQQCEEASDLMGIVALRDADLDMVEQYREQLGDVRYRRARHVVTEDERTLEMKTAMEAGDLKRAGKLLNASHASLRDDYEVSAMELDVMSSLAQEHPACYGARMMGGGFGGCAVALVQTPGVDDFLAYLEPRYSQATGRQPEFYVCKPAPGSSVEKLTKTDVLPTID
jgi:galactokinase